MSTFMNGTCNFDGCRTLNPPRNGIYSTWIYFYFCNGIDINLIMDSTFIMVYITTDSCSNVKPFSDDALLIYIETNTTNSTTYSEIYCPSYNRNNYTKTYIIQSSCIDLYDVNHDDTYNGPSPIPIEVHINNMPMIQPMSIYESRSNLQLDLGCEFIDESMCQKLIGHSTLLCDALDICWTDYDIEHDMFICDGDDIYKNDVPLIYSTFTVLRQYSLSLSLYVCQYCQAV